MARPTLFTHRKFIRLAAAVGGKAQALGSLELLWETAYASGDPFIGDAATVESIADWRGQPGALATALHAGGNGFLDLHEDGYHVHDLEDHAPEYVHKRWERERKRRQAGQTIRSQRQAAARESWKARAANDRATDHAKGGRLQDVCNASVSPPAPAPAPEISPRAPAHDPRGTGQETDTEAELPALTGTWLSGLFSRTRVEVLGGKEWHPDASAAESAADKAASIAAAAGAARHVERSIRKFWEAIRDGTHQKSGDAGVTSRPSYALGVWFQGWHGDLEEFTGVRPIVAAPARASPSPTSRLQTTNDAAIAAALGETP